MAYSINTLCDGCSACERQCPAQAIEGELGTLYRIVAALCIECGLCGAICPLEAVLDRGGQVAPRVPRSRRLRPVVSFDDCNGCGKCVDGCRSTCLAIVGRVFYGLAYLAEPHACTGCAECLRLCDRDAITMGLVDLASIDPEGERHRLEGILGVPGCPR